MFRETLNVMVQFGVLTDKQEQLLNRVCDDLKYADKKISYDSLDIFFRYDKELFDKKLLDMVGNPEPYEFEVTKK